MSKVVLISDSGYCSEHDELLLSLLDQKLELFCVVGKDCELLEEVMDNLAVGNGEDSRFITTTSHPEELVGDVIEFARIFSTKSKGEVQIVRI